MWDERLAACAAAYRSAVLSIADYEGYPASVRCTPRLDAAHEVAYFAALPPVAAGWRGKACLLFHRHNDRLEELHQLVIKGDLETEDGVLVLRVREFVTANARTDTDAMPHAGRPRHMLQFLLLGRRKAREYLAKRGAPWPPIPFDEITRKMQE